MSADLRTSKIEFAAGGSASGGTAAWRAIPVENSANRTTVSANRSIADAGDLALTISSNLDEVEQDWKALELQGRCTAFQSFEWLASWQRHIGNPRGILPAIIRGRRRDGRVLFILQLAVETHGLVRRLTWLGSDLCDYNAPLLDREFNRSVEPSRFAALWKRIITALKADERYRFDILELVKMPETVGGDINPFMSLPVVANPSGAYVTELGQDWNAFYAVKRSSSTRKRERRQMRDLAENGEVKFVHAQTADDIARTLAILIEQKQRSFERMGVDNFFARPGYREFFFDVAANPRTRELIHVSRLEVGTEIVAASVGLTFNQAYCLILSSYDDGPLSRFGPGRAHLNALLQHAIGAKFRWFDFTIGDEPYKLDWCDGKLTLRDHLAAASGRGAVMLIAIRLARRAKRLVKQTPALWNLASRFRAAAAHWAREVSRRINRQG
jgi:CelD/BcsL family acetyltransferase involved in cellulose biosynthesis